MIKSLKSNKMNDPKVIRLFLSMSPVKKAVRQLFSILHTEPKVLYV